MHLALLIVSTVLLIEAITNLLTKSEIFKPLRAWLFNSDNKVLKFIHSILDCSYCTSVWVSLFSTTMLYLHINNLLPQILALFFMGIILHRVSNIVHFIIDRLDSNHYKIGQG